MKKSHSKNHLKMTFYNSSRPKTLMELLLAKKIEAASAEGGSSRRIFRTDSMDSMSSVGSCTSSMLGEDVCRCDDCLLGIVDLYIIPSHERSSSKKKVTGLLFPELVLRKLHCEKKLNFFYFSNSCWLSEYLVSLKFTYRLQSNFSHSNLLFKVKQAHTTHTNEAICIFIAK